MVTTQMLESVVEKLSDGSFSKGRWNNPYAEIQDDFQSLFVSVSVTANPVAMDIKSDISNFLVSAIPQGGNETIGNWMVVFKRGNKVIDSWAPYDL